MDQQEVQARGVLIAADSAAMPEISSSFDQAVSPTAGLRTPRQVATAEWLAEPRQIELLGEIVDSKCLLGVMKPGRGKVHRSCAALCLEGGVPPAFLVRLPPGSNTRAPNTRGSNGEDVLVDSWIALLLDLDGRPVAFDLLRELVAQPLTLRGTLTRPSGDGTTPEFRVDPRDLSRLTHASR